MGMTHTTDIRKAFGFETVASGRLLRSFSLGIAKFVRVCGIPDQARVEGLGCTDINGCSCTMATVKVSTNTSSIDQRPMITTIRYSRVRSRLLLVEPL